jgi:acyl-coenzyme A synthetase/AMP-(fatty) acid ligase
MSAVPTVYAVLAGCPVDADISSLRFAMVGASPLPAAVRDGFQAHTGINLVEGYGLTEATCASARTYPDAPRPGSVGQRLPYQQVKVMRVGEDGRGGRHGLPVRRRDRGQSGSRPLRDPLASGGDKMNDVLTIASTTVHLAAAG